MSAEPEARGVRILLVEDNPADVDLLRRALRNAALEHELTVMDDGAEALRFVQRQGKYADAPLPDLAVLDLNLPKTDGLDILEAMRMSREFAAVPVVILSSSSSPREQAKMQELGVGRFITKPPDLEEFLKIGLTLKSLLEERKASRQASGR